MSGRVTCIRKYLLMLCCCLLSLFVFCQKADTPRVHADNFSIEQGLSDRYLNGFVKDKLGYIWIATPKGLNRFDGAGFLTYDSRPRNKQKIRINKINKLFADRLGNLLISYDHDNSGQMDVMNPLTGEITNLSFDKNGNGFKGGFYAIRQAKDSVIYLQVNNPSGKALFRFNEAKARFDKLFEFKVNHGLNADFLKTADGSFWFVDIMASGNTIMLSQKDATGKTIRSYTQKDFSPVTLTSNNIVSLVEAPGGNIWVNIKNQGVFVVPRTGQTPFVRHPLLLTGGYEFASDEKGNLLAYQEMPEQVLGACVLFTPAGKSIPFDWIYRHQAIVKLVYSEDFSRGLLAGSGNGFNCFSFYQNHFTHYLAKENLGAAAYGTSIRGITKSGKDKLFIATELEGLFELDLRTQTLSRPGDKMPQLSLLNTLSFTRNMLAQGDSVLWIAGLGGVLKYRYLQNKLDFYKTYSSLKPTGQDEVWGITFDKQGQLWIAPRSGSLQVMNPLTGEMRPYVDKDGSQPMLNAQPSFIFTGSNGNIWVGSARAGLYKIDPLKKISYRYSADSSDGSGFEGNHITVVHEDEKGLLWVGTMDAGLHLFDPVKEKVIAVYDREHGLRNSSVVGILPDEKGNFWLSTFNGLSYWDANLKTFRNYTTANGLSHNEFNRYAYFFDRENGQYYFGGMNGVNAFTAKTISTTTNHSPLFVTELSVSGSDGVVSRKQVGIVDGSSITLEPGTRFLLLRLALRTYQQAGGNTFAYKIEELDKDWNYLGNSRELRIDYPSPGTYTLRLRGADIEGNRSIREIALKLVVKQYWYKTGWAFLLYMVLLAAGSYFFYRFLLGRRLAEKETHRLQQLDAFKARFFTNISHEFRTPLTVILGMLDPLKQYAGRGDVKQVHQTSEMIGRNSRQLLTMVNQLLDLAKLESGKLELNPSNGDLQAFLRFQVESFRSYAETRDIKLDFTGFGGTLNMAFDSAKMQTILVNLVSNALKFTPDGGRVAVSLHTDPSGERDILPERVVVEVRDNGPGIAEKELDKIFDRFYQVDGSITRASDGTGVGLSLVQELVKLMQGKIMVESKQGSGTCFRVILPFEPPAAHFAEGRSVAEPVSSLHPPQMLPENAAREEEDLPLVLIVEDNPDVRFYIAETVKGGFRIATAENGELGIQKAKEIVPDIIISDVMMPEKDGFMLCEILKNDEITSHIPIILLTARADFESRIAGLKRGADAYLAKPFEPAELNVHLANLVKLRRRLQQRYAGLPHIPPLVHQDHGEEMEDAFIAKIRLVVEANLEATGFDVPELGRAMAMSRSQLFRKVKALTDASPSVLIRTIRLQKSLELLQDKELTIAEIAYQVGFSSPTYFSTAFSEQYGKSPSEWRQI